MRYYVIDPSRAIVDRAEADDLQACYGLVGLKAESVDHGTVAKFSDRSSINIVVYEYGLFTQPPDRIKYFSIGRMLFAGGAVLYAADEAGETIDLDVPPPILFFRDAAEVELAINAGDIERPVRAYGEDVVWRWPEPRNVEAEQAQLRQAIADAGKGGVLRVDDTVIITFTDPPKEEK